MSRSYISFPPHVPPWHDGMWDSFTFTLLKLLHLPHSSEVSNWSNITEKYVHGSFKEFWDTKEIL
jgi:hypothetical protein